MRIQPELNTANITLLGDFNPKIFRPDWFLAEGLISAAMAEAADIEVVHSEIVKFKADWLLIQVEKRRFIAQTDDAPYVRVADLVSRTFGELLTHTPVGIVGINRLVHFPVRDRETLDRVGKALAPQEAWGEWGPQIEGTPEKHGGLRSITMEQRNLDDRFKGFILAKVEPSRELAGRGIFVNINDHYEVEDPANVTGCKQIVDIVASHYEDSRRRAEWIIDQIMALAARS